MAAEKEDKYRFEQKYVCSAGQLLLVKSRMKALLSLDKNAKENGSYRIRSLYFDDYDNTCYYDNENGVDPREKYRIRIYNENWDKIKLELKKKQRGKTQKLSCPLTRQQCEQLLQNNRLGPDRENAPLFNRFLAERRSRLLEPKVIVEYVRVPFIGKLGNVRVTLDQNICACGHVDDFWKKEMTVRPIMQSGQHLMEVKFDEFLPDYLYRALQLENLRKTAYSKYYLCRKYTV